MAYKQQDEADVAAFGYYLSFIAKTTLTLLRRHCAKGRDHSITRRSQRKE